METLRRFRVSASIFLAPQASVSARRGAIKYFEDLQADVNAITLVASVVKAHGENGPGVTTLALTLLRSLIPRTCHGWHQKILEAPDADESQFWEAYKVIEGIKRSCLEIVALGSRAAYNKSVETNKFVECSSATRYAAYVYAIIMKVAMLEHQHYPAISIKHVTKMTSELVPLLSEDVGNAMLLEAVVSEFGKTGCSQMYFISTQDTNLARRTFGEDFLMIIGVRTLVLLTGIRVSCVSLIHYLRLLITCLRYWPDSVLEHTSNDFSFLKRCLVRPAKQPMGDDSLLFDFFIGLEDTMRSYGLDVPSQLVDVMIDFLDALTNVDFEVYRRCFDGEEISCWDIKDFCITPIEQQLCRSCVQATAALQSSSLSGDSLRTALRYVACLHESWINFVVRNQYRSEDREEGRMGHVKRVISTLAALSPRFISGDDDEPKATLLTMLKATGIYLPRPGATPALPVEAKAIETLRAVLTTPGNGLLKLLGEEADDLLLPMEVDVLTIKQFKPCEQELFMENISYLARVGRLNLADSTQLIVDMLTAAVAEDDWDAQMVSKLRLVVYLAGQLVTCDELEAKPDRYWQSAGIVRHNRRQIVQPVRRASEMEQNCLEIGRLLTQVTRSPKILDSPALVQACVTTLTLLIEAYGHIHQTTSHCPRVRDYDFLNGLMQELFRLFVRCFHRFPGTRIAGLCLASTWLLSSESHLRRELFMGSAILELLESTVSPEPGSLKNSLSLLELRFVTEQIFDPTFFYGNPDLHAEHLATVQSVKYLTRYLSDEKELGQAAAVLGGVFNSYKYRVSQLLPWLKDEPGADEDPDQAALKEAGLGWLPVLTNPDPAWTSETKCMMLELAIASLGFQLPQQLQHLWLVALTRHFKSLSSVLERPGWWQYLETIYWASDMATTVYNLALGWKQRMEGIKSLLLPFSCTYLRRTKIDRHPQLYKGGVAVVEALRIWLDNASLKGLALQKISNREHAEPLMQVITTNMDYETVTCLECICRELRQQVDLMPCWFTHLSQAACRVSLTNLRRSHKAVAGERLYVNYFMHLVASVCAIDCEQYLAAHTRAVKEAIQDAEPRTAKLLTAHIEKVYAYYSHANRRKDKGNMCDENFKEFWHPFFTDLCFENFVDE